MALNLVAYGSSDSEDNSDVDDVEQQQVEQQIQNKEIKEDIKTSKPSTKTTSSSIIAGSSVDDIVDDDEDILPSVLPSSNTGLHLPPPKTEAGLQLPLPKSSSEVKSRESRNGSLLDLPAPRPTSNISAFTPTVLPSNIADDELEEEVKPKASQRCDLVPPGKKGKKSGKIQITIPRLSDYDSDEDESNKNTKKQEPSKGTCGLFDLLPQPKNTSIKEHNRALLPHTLKKKPQPVKPKPKNTASTLNGKVAKKAASKREVNYLVDNSDDDDNDEDEGQSFFSLGETTASTESTPQVLPTPLTLGPSEKPLEFGGPSQTLPMHPASYDRVSLPGGVSPPLGAQCGPQPMDISTDMLPLPPEDNEEEEKLGMSKDDLKRLMGGKGVDAAALNNLIDVSAERQTSKDELIKHLSEEPENRGSFSKKKRKDMPTGTQKRKHQITYLAFEAKERETALKNSWAEGRANKRAAQNRYGF